MSSGFPGHHMMIWLLTKFFSVLFLKTAIFGDFSGGKVYHNSIPFARVGFTYDFRPLKLILFGLGRT